MDAETLREYWEANKDRPAFVLEHREDLMEYVTTSEPIPKDGIYGVREWLASYKATVTRQLNEAASGGGGDAESGEGGDSGGDGTIDGEDTEDE